MDRETLYIVSRPVPGSPTYVFRTRRPARDFAASKNVTLLVPTEYQYSVRAAKWGPDNFTYEKPL